MTKKEFKERCSVHVYGKGKRKLNAIYFDWLSSGIKSGYKFMVKTTIDLHNLTELRNIMYDWVIKDIEPPYTVQYRYAMTDEDRFKVSLTERF